ncbi:hypothetical protein Q7P37_010508 [Cladosporium fusiforme]
MSESNDPNPAILNLSSEEKRAFGYLFNLADTDQLGVVTGERAVPFFERTTLDAQVLGEIWQIADTENRGLLTRPGFCIVLRLIGHYQAGREPTTELAFQQAPIPKFDGIQIPAAAPGPASPSQGTAPPGALQPQTSGQPPIRVPPLDPQKVQQYSGLFEKSGAQNGQLDAGTAKAIFEKSGLPNETLGRIWMLSDKEQRGALDQTEFIVAMHLLTSMKTKSMTALPNTLPPGFYQAAARRGAPPPPGNRTAPGAAAIPRQFSGAGGPPRTQSPLARPPTFGTPPPMSAQTTGPQWLITPQEKAKYDQFFSTVDTQNNGIINGEQAVRFFSDSGLPEDTLASVWDLADINSEGQLTKDEFAVAMYLIRQQRMPNAAPLPAFLPPALVPPGMRKQNLQQQTEQTTAPAFDNANNISNMSKSAADDLFGLDDMASSQQQPVLQPQSTGASAAKDPFNASIPTSPSSPQRFQPQPQQGNTHFKPFMPTSAFGASLTNQNTGGSATSSQGPAAAGFPPQQQQQQPPQQFRAPQPAGMDDLLGEDETNAAESSKITNDTTELANMSSQIGNLRNQMEQTQGKKATTQAEVNATAAQKKDLETRLQQFRAQYEQEVRTVKDLEQQLTVSRESTKKMGQELAMLEGSYQDLSTQHQTVFQALQADQAENANLKQRIGQLNAEISRLKPELEKAKMDARQQKGMVSINKKQLATNESERDRLQNEKADLERELAASPQPSEPATMSRDVTSPALSTLSATNPFARMASPDTASPRSTSPATAMAGAPTPSAFDQLFGPSFAQADSRSGTPPATSFVGRAAPVAAVAAVAAPAVAASVSSEGQSTPAVTPPPLSEAARGVPNIDEPPPPPESRQFTPTELPIGGLRPSAESEAGSTQVMPPASRHGGTETPRDVETPGVMSPGEVAETIPGGFPGHEGPFPPTSDAEPVPGAFPSEQAQPSTAAKELSGPSTTTATPSTAPTSGKDDFDSAFAGFGNENKSTEGQDPFASSSNENSKAQTGGFTSEFPPIQSLELDDESDSDSDSDDGFGDNFTSSSPAKQSGAAAVAESDKQPTSPEVASGDDIAASRPDFTSKESTASDLPAATDSKSPPAYEESNGKDAERSGSNQFPPQFGGLLPARETSEPVPAPEGEHLAPSEAESHLQTPQTAVFPGEGTPLSATGTVFHDAYSRPVSHVPEAATNPPQAQTSAAPAAKDDFDEFDDFDGLAEAKEADKSGSDADFGFGNHSRDASEFNAAFDSPAASMSTTIADSQQASRQLNDSNGFSDFPSSASASASAGQQNASHDWDAIFSGLDNSATGNIDTSFGGAANDDPWETNGATAPQPTSPQSASTAKPPAPAPAPAITPGEEHDDPILKRLTGMGYNRAQALDALEKYDYDINKAVDHLTSLMLRPRHNGAVALGEEETHHAEDIKMSEHRLDVRTVAVIGAGVSGVASAVHLRKAGLDVTVFERNPHVGGVWVFDERTSKDAPYPSILPSVGDSPEHELARSKRKDSKTGSPVDEEAAPAWDDSPSASVAFAPPGPCYAGLKNNVSTHEMEMQCHAWNEGTEEFVGQSVIAGYVQDAAVANGVMGDVRLGTRVERVEKESGGWRVETSRLEETALGPRYATAVDSFDAVVVANGHYHAPNIPDLPGLREWKQAFPDRIQHSKLYRRPQGFRDQNVLIIGAGVSSTDIARELGDVAKTIYQSSRGGAYDLASHLLPSNAARVSGIKSFNALSSNSPSRENGSIPGTITLTNGTTLCAIDRIILATGYHSSLPFLRHLHADALTSAQADARVLITDGYQTHNLHRDIFYIPDPTLAFIGVPFHTATFSFFEFQAAALAQVFRGKVPLPAEQAMRDEYAARLARKGAGRGFHSMRGERGGGGVCAGAGGVG